MSWFDKLLIKVAIAKAAASGSHDVVSTAHSLLRSFEIVNSEFSDTSRTNECAEQR